MPEMNRVTAVRGSLIIALLFWLSMLTNIVVDTGLQLAWTQSMNYSILRTIWFAALALGWTLAHARENETTVCTPLKVGIVAFAVVGVPYYKFLYFGVKEGFRFIAILAICLVSTILVALAITEVLLPDYTGYID